MSSLQCPARIFLVIGPASLRRVPAAGLAGRLTSERIARVWCGPGDGAVAMARAVAERLAVDVVVSEDLRAGGATEDAGAWAATVVARLGPFLDEVADAHPGEAVLVIADGPVQERALTDHEVVELANDADGWRLISPAGGTRPSTPGRTPRAATRCGPLREA